MLTVKNLATNAGKVFPFLTSNIPLIAGEKVIAIREKFNHFVQLTKFILVTMLTELSIHHSLESCDFSRSLRLRVQQDHFTIEHPLLPIKAF
jgi:hypothetical protein